LVSDADVGIKEVCHDSGNGPGVAPPIAVCVAAAEFIKRETNQAGVFKGVTKAQQGKYGAGVPDIKGSGAEVWAQGVEAADAVAPASNNNLAGTKLPSGSKHWPNEIVFGGGDKARTVRFWCWTDACILHGCRLPF
jgi:hypothetical protein